MKEGVRTKKKRFLFIGLGLIIVFFISAGLLTSISANAADNILRPILGEKGTLRLESIYFGISDLFNRWHYDLFGQRAPTYAVPAVAIPATPAKSVISPEMDLSPINISSGLPPLEGEGQWVAMSQTSNKQQTIVARTFMRPDTSRPYAVVTLVKLDMKRLGIGTQAGTYYPGGYRGIWGPGIIPKSVQNSNDLLAAFNGGFQARDGHYGMIVGKTTYVPLRTNMPAVLLYQDGSVKFSFYTGQPLPANVAAVRQNGPYLVNNGIIQSTAGQGTDIWGRTITNSMYTWRSGLGITSKGNLIYAVGNSLVPQDLATALKAAGAVDAIQLDINPPWVRFIMYHTEGHGRYTDTPLLSNMVGGQHYLDGYNKDFFYVWAKSTTP